MELVKGVLQLTVKDVLFVWTNPSMEERECSSSVVCKESVQDLNLYAVVSQKQVSHNQTLPHVTQCILIIS